MITPNFVSARLTDDDKINYSTVVEHMQRTTGIKLSMGDVVRLMMRTYCAANKLEHVR